MSSVILLPVRSLLTFRKTVAPSSSRQAIEENYCWVLIVKTLWTA